MLSAIAIGNRIKERQKQLGLKQKDLILKSDISKAAISNYVNGNRIPDTVAILKISIALNTTVEWLLLGKSTNVNLTSKEKELLEAYRTADQRGQANILANAIREAELNQPMGKSSESKIG